MLHYILRVQNSDVLKQASEHNFLRRPWLQGPSAILGDICTHGESYFTLSSPAELDLKTRGKILRF